MLTAPHSIAATPANAPGSRVAILRTGQQKKDSYRDFIKLAPIVYLYVKGFVIDMMVSLAAETREN